MDKYVLVSFPEIQDFMEHKRWNECIFCIEIENHPVNDSTYAVPEDLYNEVYGITDNTKELLKEAANMISMATFELGENFNPDNIDDKKSNSFLIESLKLLNK